MGYLPVPVIGAGTETDWPASMFLEIDLGAGFNWGGLLPV